MASDFLDVTNVEKPLGSSGHQPPMPKEFRGYALNIAARLESSCPSFILRLLYATNLSRQAFFAVAAEIDLDHPDEFLHRLGVHAPDVMSDLGHLDPLAQVARALILLKPRRVIEALFGSCPPGFLGLLSRLGCGPAYGKETYRNAFELFARPEHRLRAKVLGQLPGRITAEHIAVVAGLDEVLAHRAVVERTKPAEVQALNRFVTMIADLCDATPTLVKESLDALPVGTKGVKIGEWAQSWMSRQVRLSIPVPIPDGDPDLRICLGAEQRSLGKRLRNCAESRMSYTFFTERILCEWVRPGEHAVIELALVRSGPESRWTCEQVLAPRNRRVKPAVAAAIRERLDSLGILYQASPFSAAEQDGLHALLEHYPHVPFPDYLGQRADDDAEDEDADIERMLDELEQEVRGQEAA